MFVFPGGKQAADLRSLLSISDNSLSSGRHCTDWSASRPAIAVAEDPATTSWRGGSSMKRREVLGGLAGLATTGMATQARAIVEPLSTDGAIKVGQSAVFSGPSAA